MDPGPFAEVAAELAAYIENEWTGPGSQVRIRWKQDLPDIFKVLVGKIPGERSYVDRKDRQIMLFSGVRAKSIAHEFGHVMGFQDRYYTTWQPASCDYRYQYSEEDIMSSSDTGVVLSAHWQDLAKYYQ